MRVRRAPLASIALAALAAAVVGLPGTAAAAAAPCWDDVPTDIDGGGPDVVVGLPNYDLPGKPDAGAIVVFSNVAAKGDADPKAPAARTLLTADAFTGLHSQTGARFGAAVSAWHDIADEDDADDCADLLVGAPGQTVSGQKGAGQVYLLGGSVTGLGTVRATYDETMVGAGGPEPGDEFGAAIAANSWSTVVIGAPGRDVHEIKDAGRVMRLNWTTVDGDPELAIVEQSVDEDENAEAGDRFGEVLDLLATSDGDYLVVGIPHEDVGATVDAGAVELVSPTGDAVSMVTQNRAGAGDTAETGDRYGASLTHWWTYLDTPTAQGPTARLAIGVPGEDVSGKKDAGLVSFATWTMPAVPEDPMPLLKGMAVTLTQNSAGIPGTVEAGDQYGVSVLAGEFGLDNGREHLLVGAPYEDLGSTKDAGQLSQTWFDTDASPSTGSHPLTWDQDSSGTAGAVEAGDLFGARLSALELTTTEDDDDLVWPVVLVTVPREDVGSTKDAGMAYLGYAPGQVSVALNLPGPQAGAGLEMAPMKDFLY